jgi:hypothetical protein
MKRYLLLLLSTVFLVFSCAEKKNMPFQAGLEPYPTLKMVLEDSVKYQVQILYTQIDRNEHGNALMTEYKFNLDDERYFYPASTVKLPIAILALEWLEEQTIEGLTAETIMLTDSVRPSQFPALVDSTAESGLPSIAHYIKKIILVSYNDWPEESMELEASLVSGTLAVVVSYGTYTDGLPEEMALSCSLSSGALNIVVDYIAYTHWPLDVDEESMNISAQLIGGTLSVP